MAAGPRLLGRRKATQCGLAFGAALVEGCIFQQEGPEPVEPGGSAGAGGSAGTSAGASSGGVIEVGGGAAAASSGSGGSILVPELPPGSGLLPLDVGTAPAGGDCAAQGGPVFCSEVIYNQVPAQRVLYSWTTAEQIAELRADPILLTRTEREGLGKGYAFIAIDALATRGLAVENQLLARVSEAFAKVRYAWPKPWATRMGWPDEDYGDQLIEITLRPEAWILVVVDAVGMAVIDLQNRPVTAADALAGVGRIGAIYFVRTETTGSGSFSQCSGGYREFILGNEAMVERWAIGTEQMRAVIEGDAARFDRFLEVTRDSAPVDVSAFKSAVACQWAGAATGEMGAYFRSLALASELYLPRPAELATVAETLRASLFEVDPLIVEPGG